MHLDPAPSRPAETPPLRCPACNAPTFPREPGGRTVQVRCPRGHWFDPAAAALPASPPPDDLQGLVARVDGGAE